MLTAVLPDMQVNYTFKHLWNNKQWTVKTVLLKSWAYYFNRNCLPHKRTRQIEIALHRQSAYHISQTTVLIISCTTSSSQPKVMGQTIQRTLHWKLTYANSQHGYVKGNLGNASVTYPEKVWISFIWLPPLCSLLLFVTLLNCYVNGWKNLRNVSNAKTDCKWP